MKLRLVLGALALVLSSGAFAAADAPSGWTKCAQPGATCTMTGTHETTMGKSGVFSPNVVRTGSFVCSLANFPGAPSNASWCSYNPATATASSSSSSVAASSSSSSKSSVSSSSVASSVSSSKSSSSSSVSTAAIQVFIAGDSTASLYGSDRYPRMGWGQPFQQYFKSTATIVDDAKSGASTTSFLTTSNYADIKAKMKSGDYILIQFGHNDEDGNPAATTFYNTLKTYVDYAKSVGAHPILITPVTRRTFATDGSGNMKNSHITTKGGDYPQAVRNLGSATGTPVIDLTARSMTFFKGVGDAGSKAYFLYVLASEGFPGYTSDTTDNTHFREKGAIAVGQLVVDGLRDLNSPLVQYLK
ncbi:rhamnogalacturonan acetylesterase [Uliginosibacterium sp. H3]|uniref:Rhamnogalacturonan acetylesterase n=1 Tax=Uliginosibacterium silvisoli TaxID=3114758 RepID=A0ABU6K8D8_9RHOO|nr:rhamnogalacturonan acetylesterase [Uliginosibacterium sp. H3]